MTQLIHPPYSPDLAPCDFSLFSQMKSVLKGKRFAGVEEVKKKTTEALKGITLQEFQDCFEKWNRLVHYFEGDSICNT
jgi:transposase